MPASTAMAMPQRRAWLVMLPVGFLVALALIGVGLDFAAALRFPLELDYGEGIVWQQAEMIPGPLMYGRAQTLPFIVFHYPPLYYLCVRLIALLGADVLAAGRAVSELSTVLLAPVIAALVLTATRPRTGKIDAPILALAIAAGCLALCLHAVRNWGMLMRVDMLAILLGMAGLLVAARADGRFRGTLLALLLCTAAVFTKQTQLPAGIAVFAMALLRNPRAAVSAATLVALCGVAVLAALQSVTDGGFLLNVLGYNINRFALINLLGVAMPEATSFGAAMVMLVAAAVIARRLLVALRAAGGIRALDPAMACRALMLLEFFLACLMLFTCLKSGGSYNYLLEFLCSGCVLIGVLMVDLWRAGGAGRWRLGLVVVVLAYGMMLSPWRALPPDVAAQVMIAQAPLLARIAAADRPVASENMTLLKRAGKPVIFEPAIVTELAALGRWDEAPLLAMIRDGGFAFMVTTDPRQGGTSRRSPAVDAAMREVFPRVEQVSDRLWIHLPAG